MGGGDGVDPDRLKSRERWILALLAEGASHGYALMARLGEETDGRITLGPATLYRTLDELADAGFIEPDGPEPGRSTARFPWRITEAGREALRAEVTRLAAFTRRVDGLLGDA